MVQKQVTPRGGWARRPKGGAPGSEASAVGARWLSPARPQPPSRVEIQSVTRKSFGFRGPDRSHFIAPPLSNRATTTPAYFVSGTCGVAHVPSRLEVVAGEERTFPGMTGGWR